MFVFWCLAFPSVSRAPREASTVTSNKERRNSRKCRRTRVKRLEGNPLPYERACWAPPVRYWPACEVAGSSLLSHPLHRAWVGKGDAVTEGNPCRGREVACWKQVASGIGRFGEDGGVTMSGRSLERCLDFPRRIMERKECSVGHCRPGKGPFSAFLPPDGKKCCRRDERLNAGVLVEQGDLLLTCLVVSQRFEFPGFDGFVFAVYLNDDIGIEVSG